MERVGMSVKLRDTSYKYDYVQTRSWITVSFMNLIKIASWIKCLQAEKFSDFHLSIWASR